MKYVIFQGHGLVHPVLFGDHTTHSQVKVDGTKPVSAGFVSFDKFNFPHCYGKSESLDLESRGETDENIIRRWWRGANIIYFMEEFSEV